MANSVLTRWDEAEAWAWYQAQPWLCGFNYVPSTAVNTTEMWQRDSFDPDTIARELGWAQAVGFNSCRVFVQFLVWDDDPDGLLMRIDQFLTLAAARDISTMLILFDDCGFSGKQPYLGVQDPPVPGVHNSGWTPSPAHEWTADATKWPRLREYVTSVVECFADDARVLAWDLYNEPGNTGMGAKSLPLAREAFRWARSANPSQPLTTGLWGGSAMPAEAKDTFSAALIENSDIITFHNYLSLNHLVREIVDLRTYRRPLICTEWMARTLDSTFKTHLPVFKRERVGCYCWGLVSGKTQTHIPWGWVADQQELDPVMWFHDVFRADGTPYHAEEIQVLQAHTARSES